MAPVARKPLPEEKLLAGFVKGWAYIAYTIKQLIILFPNLWAGYEMGRRKEERRKNTGQPKDSKQLEAENKDLRLFIESLALEWEEYTERASDEEIRGFFDLTLHEFVKEATVTEMEMA